MQIVTGKTGEPHITSVQDRALNQGLAGKDAYILDTGQNLEPEIYSANEIHIKDGALMAQGCLCVVDYGSYDTVTIANGSQGMKRKDLIVARYTYDAQSQVEGMEWAVIQGTPSDSTATVPSITNIGDIQALDSIVDTAVFVVSLNGVSIERVEPVISTLGSLTREQKMLWSGEHFMFNGQRINLSDKVSNQLNGICLVFSAYNSDAQEAYDYDYNSFFVPKEMVRLHSGQGFSFLMAGGSMSSITKKYLYINDDNIVGNSINNQSGTGSGIDWDGTDFVLRYVFGV